MGFSASLLVLFPRKNTVYEQHSGDNKLYRLPLEDRLKIIHARPSKSYTVWEGEHIIDFDYITRLEKVTNKRDFTSYERFFKRSIPTESFGRCNDYWSSCNTIRFGVLAK
jgi:hypothetical protein